MPELVARALDGDVERPDIARGGRRRREPERRGDREPSGVVRGAGARGPPHPPPARPGRRAGRSGLGRRPAPRRPGRSDPDRAASGSSTRAARPSPPRGRPASPRCGAGCARERAAAARTRRPRTSRSTRARDRGSIRPSWHQRQRPHVEKYVSVTIRAPRHDSSTPSPRSATTPETSCPIVTGGREAYSPSKMWTSVPQIPAATTSTTT